jgi:hypothetical protein
VALSCAALKAVPDAILAGLVQKSTGTALAMLMVAVLLAEAKLLVLAGVNETVRVWPSPAPRTVPAGGA